MRVISGKFRGITIPSPKEAIVKPTLDRIKENIFNILQFKINNSRCLDLFCGSGALGIESLSRGAKSVFFVDNNKQNILALKQFLTKLKATDYTLFDQDFYDALKSFKEQGLTFDIIFLDPPYDSNLAQVALQKIFKFDLLSQDGIVVWEHPSDLIDNKFAHKVADKRIYGKVEIDFICKNTNNSKEEQ